MQKSHGIGNPGPPGCDIAVERQRPPHLPARGPQTEQAEPDVVLERVAGKQRYDLICAGQSEVRALVGHQLRHIGAEQLDLPRIRAQVAADLIEQGSLARTVRPDDEAAFAWPDGERHVLRYDKPAERFSQVDDLERMIAGLRGHRDSSRNAAVRLLTPGTIPLGMTRTMNRNTKPSNMFHRSM